MEKKIDDLIAKMSPAEKAGQLNQRPNMAEVSTEDVANGLVGSVICATSAFAGNEMQERVRAGQINALQKAAVEKSRLKIPLLFARDVIHGHRTVAPIPLGQAASWSPEHVEAAASVAASEASADGIRWVFTPMLDIARDARWGRVAEGYGEDAFLASKLAEASIAGYQGDDPSKPGKVAACVKHFAGYGAAEGGRDYNTAEISEYTMRNVYLPPFHAAVKAGVASVMSAFNEIGGVPAVANRWLLSDLLRSEWGFRGPVVSDWDAVGELVLHGRAADLEEASAIAIQSGVDIDMASNAYVCHLPALQASHGVSEETIDEAVRRVLRLKMQLGLFERPFAEEGDGAGAQFLPTSQETVLALARRSLVLLKNSGGLLPLSSGVKRIGLFGSLSTGTRELFGTWTLDGVDSDVVTIHDALNERLPAGIELLSRHHVDESVSLARFCDVAVAVVGETPSRSGENNCVTDIGLPPGQVEWLKALKRVGVPVVAVVLSGRPLDLSWLEENVDAILLAWHPGVMGGQAIAETILGANNPSGKLPVTFPRSVGQVPIYYNRKPTGRPLDPYKRGVTRYLDSLDSPLYPFGYGQSYSRFEYSRVDRDGLTFSIDLTNGSQLVGEEVVQLYIRDEVSQMTRPVRELKGFQRVRLEAGESKRVSFALSREEFGYYGPENRWVVEPGWFTVWIGKDSISGSSVRIEL